MARTCALITPVQPILHRVSCSNETLPNAPKHYETHRTWVYGLMGWIGCVHFEKFRCDFVARTFALIAPVQPVLHQASCSNVTIQNAPKHYEMQQYKSLGSNAVGRVHSLRKILTLLCGTNFCSNCTSLAHFHRISCNNKMAPIAPKHYKTQQNMSLGSNGGGSGMYVAKNSDATWVG